MNVGNAQAAHGESLEARLLTALRNGDDDAYITALQDAQFVVPMRQDPAAPGAQAQPLVYDIEGRRHLAVFTSPELAQRGIAAAFGGDLSGWSHATYNAATLASAYGQSDTAMVVNAGTSVQKALMVSSLARHRRAGPQRRPPRSAPGPRRGSIRTALVCIAMTVVAFGTAMQLSNDDVFCGSQTMDVDDTCVVVTDNSTNERTYEEMQRAQGRQRIMALGVGSVTGVAAIYNVGALITSRRRR